MTPPDIWPPAPTVTPPGVFRKQKRPVFIAGFVMSLLSFALMVWLDDLFLGTRPGAMVDFTPLVMLPLVVAAGWCLADGWRGIRRSSKVSVVFAVLGLLVDMDLIWGAVFVRLK